MRVICKWVRAFVMVLAFAVVTAGCNTRSDINFNPDLLQLSKLQKVQCAPSSSKAIKPELKKALQYVRVLAKDPSSREFEDVIVLNPGQKNLSALENALKAKLEGCKGGPKPSTVDEFTIKMPKRDGHRLNENGIDPTKRGNAAAFKKEIEQQAKTDPLTIFVYYQASPLGQIKPLPNEGVIAKGGIIKDGNVYSAIGRQAYKEWVALWNSPLTKVTAVKEITFAGYNTGVVGTSVTHSTGVRGGDLSGVDVTYYDAQGRVVGQHSALNRCTQPTTNKPVPGTPPGKTDTPPPPRLDQKDVADHPVNQGNAPSDGWEPAPPINEQQEPATEPGGGTPSKTYTTPPAPTQTPTPRPDPTPESPPTTAPVPSGPPTCDPDICEE